MTIYARRSWLSENTLSSGYIMCVYHPGATSYSTTLTVRLADCERTFILTSNLRRLKSFIADIDTLLSVVVGKRKQATFGPKDAMSRYRASLQEENGISRLTLEAIVSQKLSSKFKGFKAKEIIQLHQEELDSDKSNWNTKLKVVEKVLTEFKAFLQTLTKEKP